MPITVLRPLVEEAYEAGNPRPAEILHKLEAANVDSYFKPLGHNVEVAERILEAVEWPSGKSWCEVN